MFIDDLQKSKVNIKMGEGRWLMVSVFTTRSPERSEAEQQLSGAVRGQRSEVGADGRAAWIQPALYEWFRLLLLLLW